MAISYSPKNRGRRGGFTRLGDHTGEVRKYYQDIIDSQELARRQHAEITQEYKAGMRGAMESTEWNRAQIENLETKKHANKLEAVKTRARQEGQKGRDQARFMKEASNAEIKKTEAMFGLLTAGAKVGWFLKKKDEHEKGEEDETLMESTYESLDDDAEWSNALDKLIEKDDEKLREEANKMSTFSERLGFLHRLQSARYSSSRQSAQAKGEIGNIQALQEHFIAQLRRDGEIVSDANFSKKLEDFLGHYLAINGWDSSQAEGVIEFKKKWRQIAGLGLLKEKRAKNAYLSAKLEDEETATFLSKYTAGDLTKNITAAQKLRETLGRTYGTDGVSFRNPKEVLDVMGKSLAENLEINDYDLYDIFKNLKDDKGVSVLIRHPKLWDEISEHRTNRTNQIIQDKEASLKRAVLTEFNVILPEILKDPSRIESGEAGELAKKYDKKYGKNNAISVALRRLDTHSKQNYLADKQADDLRQMSKTGDIKGLIEYRNSAEFTTKERRDFNNTYLPNIKFLQKAGFSPKDLQETINTTLKGELDVESLPNSPEPISLEATRIIATIDFYDYVYKLIGDDPRGADAEDVLNKATTWIDDRMRSNEGAYKKVGSTDKRIGESGAAEFIRQLPGGLAAKDDPNWYIGVDDFKALVEDKGSVSEALMVKGSISKSHLMKVYRNIKKGRNFEVLPGIRRAAAAEGTTIQEIYKGAFKAHDMDVEIPTDLISEIEKDTVYDRNLKDAIRHTATVHGFWNILYTEAEGKKNLSGNIKSSEANANNELTTTGSTGVTTINETESTERTAGSPDHQPGGKLSQYNKDGTPKLKFNNPKAAENISWGIQQGFFRPGDLISHENSYYDLISLQSPIDYDFSHLGFYPVPDWDGISSTYVYRGDLS